MFIRDLFGGLYPNSKSTCIGCDGCRRNIMRRDSQELVFHCPLEMNAVHPDGFDICMECMENHRKEGCYKIMIKSRIFDLFRNLNKVIMFPFSKYVMDLLDVSSVLREYKNRFVVEITNYNLYSSHSKYRCLVGKYDMNEEKCVFTELDERQYNYYYSLENLMYRM